MTGGGDRREPGGGEQAALDGDPVREPSYGPLLTVQERERTGFGTLPEGRGQQLLGGAPAQPVPGAEGHRGEAAEGLGREPRKLRAEHGEGPEPYRLGPVGAPDDDQGEKLGEAAHVVQRGLPDPAVGAAQGDGHLGRGGAPVRGGGEPRVRGGDAGVPSETGPDVQVEVGPRARAGALEGLGEALGDVVEGGVRHGVERRSGVAAVSPDIRGRPRNRVDKTYGGLHSYASGTPHPSEEQ